MTITFLFILLPIRFIVREDCEFLFRSELRFKNCETSFRSDYSSSLYSIYLLIYESTGINKKQIFHPISVSQEYGTSRRISLQNPAASGEINIFHVSLASRRLNSVSLRKKKKKKKKKRTDLNSLPRGSLSGDGGPPIPLPAPSLREDARALDMYAAGAGGGLQGGQQTGLLPPGVERV